MIEINPSKDGIIDFLEIEENFTMKNYEKENIYILQYLRRKCVSYGTSLRIEDHEIFHLCSTDQGSSGSPILNINSNKVIGIHLQAKKGGEYNVGTLLHYVIKDFNEDKNLINLYIMIKVFQI